MVGCPARRKLVTTVHYHLEGEKYTNKHQSYALFSFFCRNIPLQTCHQFLYEMFGENETGNFPPKEMNLRIRYTFCVTLNSSYMANVIGRTEPQWFCCLRDSHWLKNPHFSMMFLPVNGQKICILYKAKQIIPSFRQFGKIRTLRH